MYVCRELSKRVLLQTFQEESTCGVSKILVAGDWSLVTGDWWLVTGHWWLVTGHWSLVTGHWSLVTGHWSLVTGHWSLVTGHWSLVTGHWSLVTGHWSLVTGIWLGRGNKTYYFQSIYKNFNSNKKEHESVNILFHNNRAQPTVDSN